MVKAGILTEHSAGATLYTYPGEGGSGPNRRGDGLLIKKVVDPCCAGQAAQATVYIGPHYEIDVNSGQETKYYFLGSQRVAMQKGGAVTYLHTDHLGSTSVASEEGGDPVGDALRYFPYGAERAGSPETMPTDYLFTGQRREATADGLYHMGARFYDPYINRFVSPDSIAPQPGDPQSLNRYSYCLGNPVKYADPTGHLAEGEFNTGDLEVTLDLLRLANDILYWLQWVHPALEGFHWAEAEGFVINEFNTPFESEFSGEKIDTARGLEGSGSYKEDFLYSFRGVAGKGSGLADSDKVIVSVANPDGWKEDYSALNNPATFEFAAVGSGALPEPWSIIAVNRATGIVPWKARVYIPALDVQLADRDGFVRATGHGSLDKNEIDLYAGLGQVSMQGPPDFFTDDYTIYFLVPND